MILRAYQSACVSSVRETFGRSRSALIVLPTGTGKTIVFAEIIRLAVARGRKALALAHRTELLEQARAKLLAAGVRAEIEQGSRRAGRVDGHPTADCVVASVQSLTAKRLAWWDDDAFGIIIVDEAHHATAASYQRVFQRFPRAWRLGVTATPDRLDGRGLADAFGEIAYQYGIREAIGDGWLSPIVCKVVRVEGIRLDRVKSRGGDLAIGDLETEMIADDAVIGVADPLAEMAGDRQTIVFAVSVAHAAALADRLWVLGKRSASLHGGSSAELRERRIQEYARGEIQFLVNCQLFVEGFDAPATSCVAVARPTKSRALYTQMVGRGLRVATGKTDCLVLDFVGQATRHSLISPADLFGASSREVGERARERSEETGETIEVALEAIEAEVEIEGKRLGRDALVHYQTTRIDPFLGRVPMTSGDRDRGEPATDRQLSALASAGVDFGRRSIGVTRGYASDLLAEIQRRHDAGLCTIKQARMVSRFTGRGTETMTKSEATGWIMRIKANGWRPLR